MPDRKMYTDGATNNSRTRRTVLAPRRQNAFRSNTLRPASTDENTRVRMTGGRRVAIGSEVGSGTVGRGRRKGRPMCITGLSGRRTSARSRTRRSTGSGDTKKRPRTRCCTGVVRDSLDEKAGEYNN